MKNKLPPSESLVCVDNTIIFKAVYNPASVITELFSVLILERNCILYTTEKNLIRCYVAVEGKVLKLIKKLLEERDPGTENFKRYSLIIDALKLAYSKVKKGKNKTNQERLSKAFTEELINQVRAFLDQRFEFIRSFINVKDYSFYKMNFQKAISILGDDDPDHEDAHILALAITLHEKNNAPVYLWTDDSDFYDVEPIIKGYGVIPFRRVDF